MVQTEGSNGRQEQKSAGKIASEKCVVSSQSRIEFNAGDVFMERVLQEKAEMEEEMQKCQER